MYPVASLDVTNLGTVLGVWAHPDDEVFLAAGLAARVTDAGGHVACVTATRGEHGTDDPATWPPDRLGRRRALELRASLAAVGVTDHRFLDHVDGTLPHVADAVGVAQVAAVIEYVRPDTVVTFGPEGMTGHPDHVAVSRWTTEACRAARRPLRLLYATTTEDFTRRWASVNEDTGAFGDGLPLATPTDLVALQVRLGEDELDRKLIAMMAQSSQMGPLLAMLGEDTLRRWWGVETFTRAPLMRYPDRRLALAVGALP